MPVIVSGNQEKKHPMSHSDKLAIATPWYFLGVILGQKFYFCCFLQQKCRWLLLVVYMVVSDFTAGFVPSQPPSSQVTLLVSS